MVVDDQDDVRKAIALIFRTKGFQNIEEYSDGSKAVEAFLKNRFVADLIIMDWHMMIMDGIQATRAIRNINPNVKIILCSAYEESPTDVELFDLILRKPVSISQIVSAVNKIFSDKD